MTDKLNMGVYVGKPYNTSETIRIVNSAQGAAYWANGIVPLDIFPSRDYETGKPIIVFVFNRAETQEVYEKWQNYELK